MQQCLLSRYFRFYPQVKFAFEATNIGFTIAYALNLIRFHSLSTWLLRVEMNDVNAGSNQFSDQASNIASTGQKIFNAVNIGMETGAFIMQFLSWWVFSLKFYGFYSLPFMETKVWQLATWQHHMTCFEVACRFFLRTYAFTDSLLPLIAKF